MGGFRTTLELNTSLKWRKMIEMIEKNEEDIFVFFIGTHVREGEEYDIHEVH